jgi:glycosyltransferase involved in cell wall biosynthesis
LPTVSVVIPTHNRATLIGEAIATVLNQTFRDFELLVVDDASSDNTQEVVRSFADPRVRYIRQGSNGGDHAARNAGIRASSGEFIAFLDDDDEWLPPKLELQTEYLRARGPEVGGVHTASFTVDKGTGETRVRRLPDEIANLPDTVSITTSAVMVRRLCFETLGLFDESIPFCSDFDMWIRIVGRYRFGYIATPLVRYFVHSNRLSSNYGAMSRGEGALLTKHPEFFSRGGPRRHAARYLYSGVLYCYGGDLRKGRAAFRRAMRLNPADPRNYFNFVLSFLGANGYRRAKALKQRLRESAAW